MNNLLKAAARKHALASGTATAKWTDEDIAAYVDLHGISERDNLKPVSDLVRPKPEDEVLSDKAISTPKGSTPKSGVESAIADFVSGLGVDEDRVIDLIKEHSVAPRTHVVEVQEKGEVVARIDGAHKDMPIVMAHIAAGVNIAAVGPAGSGKSTMFKQIADSLGLDYYIVGAVQQESKIMGYNDANGNYVRTPFRDAYENGGLICIEEFDGSSAKAMLAANNAVANEWTDFPDGMVERHPDFVCVMAGNTFGTGASRQYVGRTQLDAATLDRFCFLEIGYDEDLETAIALAVNSEAAGWVAEVQAFRARVEEAGLRHVVSPRASLAGAKLLKQGLPLEMVRKSALHKSLSADQIRQLSA